jgi:hypothetical protein
MIEHVKYKGVLTLKEIDGFGNERTVFEENNVATLKSTEVLANLLKESSVQNELDHRIAKIKISDLGVTETRNEVTPADPSEEIMIGTETVDVNLTNVTVGEVEGHDAVIYEFFLDNEDGNGGPFDFKEYGLFTDNDILFAKKHYPSYKKTSDRQLKMLWGIYFERTS